MLNVFNLRKDWMTKTQAYHRRACRWVLTAVCGLALIGCDKFSQKTPQQHVEKAKAYLDAGDLKNGSIELKTALQQQTDLVEARRLLGQTDLAMGKGADAEKELRQAVSLGLARRVVLQDLAESLEMQGKFKEILDEITVEPSLLPFEQAYVHVYRGNALLALGQLEQAKTEYEDALHANPASPFAMVGLARLSIADKDLAKAGRWLDEAVKAGPKEAKVWSFRGDYFKAKEEPDIALESYTKAIELGRNNFVDRGNRALILLDMGKYTEAAEDARVLRRDAPNFFAGHLVEGLLALADKDYAKAQAGLQEAMKQNPRYLPLYYYLAYVHLMQNHLEQADQLLSEFLKGLPNSVGGHALMAMTKLRLGDYAGARQYAEPLLKAAPKDPGAVQIMGLIDFAQGDRDSALKLLEKAVILDPKSAYPQLAMGLALLGKGEKEKGIAAMEAAVKLDESNADAWSILALTEIEQRQYDKAKTTIAAMKARQPDSPLPLDLEGTLHSAQGQAKQANESFQAAWAKSAGNPMAGLNLARQAMAANKMDEARGYLEKILALHPQDLNARLTLVELDAAQGRYAEAQARLEDTVKQFPQAVQPRVILARHFVLFGQPQQALPLLKEIAAGNQGDPVFLETYTQVLVENRQGDTAIESAKEWARLKPGSAEAHYWLARAYADSGQALNTSLELDRALAIDRNLVSARIMQVQTMGQNSPDKAVQLMDELRRDHPDNVQVLTLAGWLARQRNQMQSSLLAYQQAFDKSKTHETVTNLAQAQWFSGHKEQAVSTLEKWREQYPQDWAARVVLSGMYADLGKEREALAELEKASKSAPSNPVILNELAWRLRKSDPSAALNHAEKAYAIAPNDLTILDTLTALLTDTGAKERALRLLRQSRKQMSGNFTLRFHYAAALAEAGDSREAMRELQDLLSVGGSFAERLQADELLKKLSDQEREREKEQE
jgi:putative PEP-CTERM system TPR-repeat lipoprotein